MKAIREKQLFTLCVFGITIGSCVDFFDIAWGTGVWLGEFAKTWTFIFLFFCLLSVIFLFGFYKIVWSAANTGIDLRWLISAREKIGQWKWVLAILIFCFPIWFLQLTEVGIVVRGAFLRIGVWSIQLFFLSFLLAKGKELFLSYNNFLFVIVLTATTFSIAATLRFVTGYPFSIGWSEGNRLWDYSILFGRERYLYPANQEIKVFLDLGRQLVGGLPFIFSGLTIGMARLWVGLTSILPYIFLGILSFRANYRDKYVFLILILWTCLFLKQGPIHPPLIIYAGLTALAWRNKTWLSILLVILTTIFAYISRYTWVFAPILWFFMLESLSDQLENPENTPFTPRLRSLMATLVLVTIGSILFFVAVMSIRSNGAWRFVEFVTDLSIYPENLLKNITKQPLLWYRLFPNETYGNGILAGLFFAVAPLAGVLSHMLKQIPGFRSAWLKFFVFFPLVAFLIVGLIVSSKIGGGADLHNMDMFLIGIFFIAATVLRYRGQDWIPRINNEPLYIKCMLVFLVVIPAIFPLMEMRSYTHNVSESRLVALTDAPNDRALEMYPPEDIIEESLNLIQSEADLALENGDVLFMDQRQLLTFGFIEGVPLVPEYDKKALMEFAMTKRLSYFEEFYSDLEQKRFSLVITQPLNTPRKGSEDGFGEENNAWVVWVAKPLLCFYDIKHTLLDVNVQLLTPKNESVDCAKILP